MRAFSAAAILFFFTVTAQVNAQEDIRGALEQWLGVDQVPGLSLTYGSIEDDDGEWTIADIRLDFETILEADWGVEVSGIAGTCVVQARLDVPKTVLKGVAPTADGVGAEHVSYPEDLSFSLSFVSEDAGRIAVTGGMEDYHLEGVFLPFLPDIADDNDRQFSRLAPLFQAYKKIQVERSEMGLQYADIDADLSQVGFEFVSGKISQMDTVVTGWRDGKIATIDVGEYREEYTLPDGSGNYITDVSTLRETHMRDYDLGAFADLLDPDSGLDEAVILGSMVQTGNVNEGVNNKSRIDTFSVANVMMKRPDFDLAGYSDSVMADKEIDEDVSSHMFLELLRALSVERISMEGVDVELEEEGLPVKLKLAEFLLADFGSEGIGEFSMTDFEFGVENVLDTRFERVFIKDVGFPSVSWMRQLIDSPVSMEEADPLLLSRAFMPTALTVGLGDLSLQFAETDEALILKGFHSRLESAVSPIPTLVELAIDGFEMSADMIEDPDVAFIFESFEIDRILFNEDFHIAWDESTGDVTIDRLVLDLGQFGELSGRMQIGGVPRFVLENPESPEALMVTANLKSLELDFENAGAVETMIAARARNDETSEEEAQTALLLQALNNLTPFVSEEFLAQTEAELSAFLEDPKSFRVTLKPANPLPIARIAAGYMTSPQTLPQLLGLTVEANQ